MNRYIKTREYKKPPGLKGYSFTEKEIENAKKNRKILTVTIETTRICNLRCRYCFLAAGNRVPNELSTEELLDIVDQAKRLKARSIVVIGGGEPLLYKDLMRLVEYIDGRRMDTVLFTNCTLMTDEVAEQLFNHNVSVIGKLNSFDPLVQDYLANRIGTFNNIMAGLEALMRTGFNKTNPTRLGVESIICNQNIEDIPRIWVWCRERNIYPFMELMNIRGRALMQEMDVTPEQAETLFNKVLEIDQLQFGYTWFPSPPFIGYHCQKYYYGIYIDSQGWVQPCSGAGMHLGNIRNNSLREIMGKGIFRKTQNIGEYLEGKCRNCPHNRKCYGCRGYTYSTSGNIFGEDDRCWHCN